jgi:hypothetical protein
MCSQIQPLLDDVAPRNARSPLQKTSLRGLQIYRPTGQYYAHFRANGKPVRKRLETTVRAIAEQNLEIRNGCTEVQSRLIAPKER